MTRLKFRRHYKLLVLLALVVAVLVAGAGDQRIIAYSVQGTEQVAGPMITYVQAVAAHVHAAADSIWNSGTVQDSSAANSQ
jgi:hypothetical protein